MIEADAFGLDSEEIDLDDLGVLERASSEPGTRKDGILHDNVREIAVLEGCPIEKRKMNAGRGEIHAHECRCRQTAPGNVRTGEVGVLDADTGEIKVPQVNSFVRATKQEGNMLRRAIGMHDAPL